MKVLAGLAAALLLISACQGGLPSGSPAGATGDAERDLAGPVSITLWHSQTGSVGKALQEQVDAFNGANGLGITVAMAYQGNPEQLYRKTLAAIQTGTVPELAVGYESFVADYQRSDVVLDLGPYLRSKKHALSQAGDDDILTTYLEANRFPQFGNRLLSFPFAKSLLVMYQNDDLLKASGQVSPRTWDEFEKAARAATQKGADGKTVRYGWAVPLSASAFNGWVLSRGGRLMSEDARTVAWDGTEGVESLRLLQKLIGEGVAYVPKGFDHQTDFAAGKVAFLHDSSTVRPFIASALPRDRASAWSIAGIPQADPARPKTVQFGPNLIAFRSTPDKQLAAWLFMRWSARPERTAAWSIASSYLPLRRSAADDAALKASWAKDTQGKAAFEFSPTGLPEPTIRGQQDIRTVIEELLAGVATGRLADVERAVKDAGAKANAILKENR